MYAQGYQVAAETISSSGEVARGNELVEETVAALKAERAGGGAGVPTTEDPVVVSAYGLAPGRRGWTHQPRAAARRPRCLAAGATRPVREPDPYRRDREPEPRLS